MKLFITKFSLTSCYFLLLQLKYPSNQNRIRRTFYTSFPVEKLTCVLNSRNVHLSNLFPKPHIQKLDAQKFKEIHVSSILPLLSGRSVVFTSNATSSFRSILNIKEVRSFETPESELPPISSSWRQAPSDSRPVFFFQLNTCSYSPYVTSSLKRGWACRLQLLLALASAVILKS
jgi:hypothetical protein